MDDLNIPKVLHLYWGRNKKLSYMKYLTAKSFSSLNPEWKIKVYFPDKISDSCGWSGFEQKSYEYEGIDYFAFLDEIENVEMIKFDFSIWDLPENISEVHKSDLLRLHVLSTEGGIWSDFDIFFLKPISELKLKYGESQSKTGVCFNYGYHSIGFLFSTPNNSIWRNLFDIALNLAKIHHLQYQTIGSGLYFKYFKEIIDSGSIVNMPFISVYPFQWNQIDDMLGNHSYDLFEKTIGIHWFAGSDKVSKYENIITKDNLKEHKDIFLLKLMGEFCE